MATSLLDPDSSVWNTPLLLKGDDTPDALRPDPQADALGQTYSAITDYMARQQQQSADQGLWDNTTGLPTQKGLLDAIGQTGTAVALGTGSGGDAPAGGLFLDRFDPRTGRKMVDPDLTIPGNHAYFVRNPAGEHLGTVETEWDPNVGDPEHRERSIERGREQLWPGGREATARCVVGSIS